MSANRKQRRANSLPGLVVACNRPTMQSAVISLIGFLRGRRTFVPATLCASVARKPAGFDAKLISRAALREQVLEQTGFVELLDHEDPPSALLVVWADGEGEGVYTINDVFTATAEEVMPQGEANGR